MTLWHNIYCNDERRECKPHHKARHQNTTRIIQSPSLRSTQRYPKHPKAQKNMPNFAEPCQSLKSSNVLLWYSSIQLHAALRARPPHQTPGAWWSMDEHEVMISDDSQNDQQKARGWWSETGTSKLQTARLFLSFSPMFARHAVMLASSKGSVQELLAGSWLAPSLLGNHLQNSTNLQTLCFAGNHLQTNQFASKLTTWKPLRNPVNSSCQMLPMTTGDPPANQKGQILSNLYPYKRYKPLVQQEENQKILIRKSQLNRNEWNTGLLRPVSSNSGASALAEGETWSPCVSPCMSTSILIFSNWAGRSK